jgi:hypothetical protein
MRDAESQYIWQLCVLPSTENASIPVILLDQSCLTVWLVWFELAQFVMFLTCFGKAPASKLGRDADRHDRILSCTFLSPSRKITTSQIGMYLLFQHRSQIFYIIHIGNFLKIPCLNPKMNKSKYHNTYNKTHFILGTSCYMFRQQGAIVREFIRRRHLA